MGAMFTFGPGISRDRPLWAGFAVAAWLVCCSGAGSAGLACLSWGCLVTVPGSPPCQGGVPAVARSVRVLRRRRRVLGGRPAAARRALSAWRASQAVRIRWLRTTSRQASQSISGVRPISRVQPRAMLLLAGSLAVEKVRSAPVRRA